MRKGSDNNSSTNSELSGFTLGKDPVLGMSDRRLRRGGSWVSTYGPATVLPSAKAGTPADRVSAIFAADADARKQKEVRRAQARQRDIDALTRRIQELPGLYNQDRDRLTAYVNRNVPTSGSLQDYAVGLKRVSQEVLGAAGQGPAGIARLTQEQNEADRQAAQFPWMQGTNSRGHASGPRPGSLEDRMLALDSTFGNDPTYRRQRDVIKYRVQDNARREASRALAYKRDPDADVKTALHAIDRRDLNSRFQRAQATQRLQDQVNRETAANADSIRAGNPSYAASAEQSDDFTHQTGAMTPGEIGQARVDHKIADARNEWLQAYKSLNLDLYKLPAGAARAIPGLLWQMFIGSTLSPEQRKKQFEVFNSTGIFDNLANRIPLMGTLDGLSQVSNLLEESARNRSVQPLADAAEAFVADKIASFNPVNRFRSMNPWEEGITDREKVDRAFNLMDFGMSSGDRVGKVIQKYKDRQTLGFGGVNRSRPQNQFRTLNDLNNDKAISTNSIIAMADPYPSRRIDLGSSQPKLNSGETRGSGREGILAIIHNEVRLGNIEERRAQLLHNWLSKLPDHILDTVSVGFKNIDQDFERNNINGYYNPDTMRIKVLRETHADQIVGTVIHEIAHHMSQYFTEEEMNAIREQFYKERDKVDLATMKRESKFDNVDEWWAETIREHIEKGYLTPQQLRMNSTTKKALHTIGYHFATLFDAAKGALNNKYEFDPASKIYHNITGMHIDRRIAGLMGDVRASPVNPRTIEPNNPGYRSMKRHSREGSAE